MVHPKSNEKKFRIAAKATPRRTITKAGHILDPVVAATQAFSETQDNGTGLTTEMQQHIAGEAASKWKEITEVIGCDIIHDVFLC